MQQQVKLFVGLAGCAILAISGCAETQPATTKERQEALVEISEQLPPPRPPEAWEREQDKEVARLIQDLEEQRKRVTKLDQELWQTLARFRPASPKPSPAPEIASAGHTTYAWLAEDLTKRIAQFLWYPVVARVNGWEGKVLVHLLVRENGEFVAARVAKSSGHKLLDANSIDTVRRACSVKLRQPLDKPVVIVAVPVIYKLK